MPISRAQLEEKKRKAEQLRIEAENAAREVKEQEEILLMQEELERLRAEVAQLQPLRAEVAQLKKQLSQQKKKSSADPPFPKGIISKKKQQKPRELAIINFIDEPIDEPVETKDNEQLEGEPQPRINFGQTAYTVEQDNGMDVHTFTVPTDYHPGVSHDHLNEKWYDEDMEDNTRNVTELHSESYEDQCDLVVQKVNECIESLNMSEASKNMGATITVRCQYRALGSSSAEQSKGYDRTLASVGFSNDKTRADKGFNMNSVKRKFAEKANQHTNGVNYTRILKSIEVNITEHVVKGGCASLAGKRGRPV
jgi:hypothetical protein